MAALLPPCVHLPDPNEYALCSLFSISCMALSLHPPQLLFTHPCMVHSLPPPSNTTSPPSSSHLIHSPPLHRHWHRCMCCCMAPRRLAWHWPPTPQDHSGTLGAEEFKACLISLGFDIANDAQVLNRSSSPAARSLTGFFFFFLLVFFPSRISILPLFPPLLRIPLA